MDISDINFDDDFGEENVAKSKTKPVQEEPMQETKPEYVHY